MVTMVPTSMGYLMGKTRTYRTYVTHSGPPRAFNLLDSAYLPSLTNIVLPLRLVSETSGVGKCSINKERERIRVCSLDKA